MSFSFLVLAISSELRTRSLPTFVPARLRALVQLDGLFDQYGVAGGVLMMNEKLFVGKSR